MPHMRIIPSTQILARVFVYFPDSGLYLSNGFDFYFVYFGWRDTENQQ